MENMAAYGNSPHLEVFPPIPASKQTLLESSLLVVRVLPGSKAALSFPEILESARAIRASLMGITPPPRTGRLRSGKKLCTCLQVHLQGIDNHGVGQAGAAQLSPPRRGSKSSWWPCTFLQEVGRSPASPSRKSMFRDQSGSLLSGTESVQGSLTASESVPSTPCFLIGDPEPKAGPSVVTAS